MLPVLFASAIDNLFAAGGSRVPIVDSDPPERTFGGSILPEVGAGVLPGGVGSLGDVSFSAGPALGDVAELARGDVSFSAGPALGDVAEFARIEPGALYSAFDVVTPLKVILMTEGATLGLPILSEHK